MKRPRKRFKTRLDPKLALVHQLPIRWSEQMLERAAQAAEIVSEREREQVTMTEILRDGGNRHVDQILAADQAVPTDERRQEPRRQQGRRLSDPQPQPIVKVG